MLVNELPHDHVLSHYLLLVCFIHSATRDELNDFLQELPEGIEQLVRYSAEVAQLKAVNVGLSQLHVGLGDKLVQSQEELRLATEPHN